VKYYVYVLKSESTGDVYVGSTNNVENRFRLHNNGKVKSTKGYQPSTLLETHACRSRAEAVALERFLKTGQQKRITEAQI